LALKQKNERAVGHRDRGLLEHPALSDPELAGKFKVPSLRNVAITGPYMHNGIFRELRTAILFYNKYTIRTKQSQTNPETGIPWGAAEVPETIDTALLNQGQPIDDGRAKALIAFLNTLTDARYESLINP
jgi:cytochrome c peroxidase